MSAAPAPYQGPALWHLGYLKSGSSFLQHAVFNREDGRFGLAAGRQNRWHLMDMLRTHDDYTFDAPALRARIAELEAPVRGTGRVPVWSDETLLGNPLGRAYCGPDVLRRLVALKLNARFLISVREQKAFALSAYRESLRAGRWRLSDFIGTPQEPMAMRPILRPEFMAYHHAVGAYQDAFGSDAVLVLPLEMLRDDAQGYLDRIYDFMDVPSLAQADTKARNIGRGGTALVVQRGLNAFVRPIVIERQTTLMEKVVDRSARGINLLAPKALDRKIEAGWKAAISKRYKGLYADSNRALADQTGLDLKGYGYD